MRRLADDAIPALTRALKVALRAAANRMDVTLVAAKVAHGLYADVARGLDWNHASEAMRLPLGLLGNVWLGGGAIGARKINGAFTNRRRVVRFKKMAGEAPERRVGQGAHALAAGGAILPEDAFAAMVVEKDASDLFDYDRFDPVTQAHIRAYQDAFITSLTAEARITIEQTILAALRAGLGPEEIAAQIKAVIGLTTQQANAVLNFRQLLLDADPAALSRSLMTATDRAALAQAINNSDRLTMGDIDRMVERYEDSYLTSRAMTIATTEATRAASLGLQDSYEQAIARGAMPVEAVRQYWQISLDEKTCDGCISVVDMNPDGVQLGQQFDSEDGPIDGPPYHPNCRCSIELVTNLDLVSDDAFE